MKAISKKLISLALVGVLTAAIAGCGTQPSAQKSSGAQEEVTIAQASWIGFAPFYIAADKGYFDKHGVKVKIESIESKADSKSALASGRVQGVSTTVDTHIMNASSGIDLARCWCWIPPPAVTASSRRRNIRPSSR